MNNGYENYKPDSTITLLKGFPFKSPFYKRVAEDQTIDLKESKQYEGNGQRN